MKKLLLILVFLCWLPFVAPQHHKVAAVEFISGETASVPEQKLIDGSLFISGNSVVINGEVEGDVFCAGQDITITGPVHGDILCAGQTIRLNNVTDGNIRVAGQSVDIAGIVGMNATVFGQTITVTDAGIIDGELLAATQKLQIDGYIGKDIEGWSQTTIVNGDVNRNIQLETEALSVNDGATVGGNLTYTSDQQATVAQGATIAGLITKHTPKLEPMTPSPKSSLSKQNRSQGFGFLMTTILFGVLLLLIVPDGTIKTLLYMKQHWVETFGRGLLVLIVVPGSIIFLLVTLIGIPLAVIVGVLFGIMYVLGRIMVAIFIGRLILENVHKVKADSPWWGLGVGTVFLWALFTVPLLGGIASFIVTIFGFGAATILLLPKTVNRR